MGKLEKIAWAAYVAFGAVTVGLNVAVIREQIAHMHHGNDVKKAVDCEVVMPTVAVPSTMKPPQAPHP